MKRIKDLRTERGYTQKAIADMLKTTQQTVARWETGVSEPSLTALRDLAMIFGVSVDDLLGTNPLNKKPQTTSYSVMETAAADTYWGNFGISVPGHDKTKWFPITWETAKWVRSSLLDYEVTDDWLTIQTLNNRILSLQPRAFKRFWLLDEACDEVAGDWEVGWDEVEGRPLELYRCLDNYFSYDETAEEVSDTLKAIIEGIVQEEGFTENNIYEFLHYTHIYFKDGSSTSYWAEGRSLRELVYDVQTGSVPLSFDIDAFGGDFESYFPAEHVALVNMPLLDVMDAAKREEAKE